MTEPRSPILVTGATGNTGRALVDELARRGAPVRALVRAEADWARLPAGVADFDDPASIAAALTKALGREVAFIDVPPEAFAESLRGILPPWQVEGLGEDYAHYRRGEAALVSPAVAEITRRPPVDVRQFARDYAPAFRVL